MNDITIDMDEPMIEHIEIPIISDPISPIPSEPDDSDKACPFICSECDIKFYSSIAFNSHKLSHTQSHNTCDYPLPSFDNIHKPIKIKEEYDSDEQMPTYRYDFQVPFAIKEEVVDDTKEGNCNRINYEDSAHTSNNILMNNKQKQGILIDTEFRNNLTVDPINTDLEVKLELPDAVEVGVYLDPDGRLDFFSLDDDSSNLNDMHLSSQKNKFLNEYTDPFMNDHGGPDKQTSLEVKQVPILDNFNKSDIKKIQAISPTNDCFYSDDSFNVDYESSDFPSEWEDSLDETLCPSINDQPHKSQINYNEQSNFIKIKCSFKLPKIIKLESINAFGCSDCDFKSQNMQQIKEHIMSYKPHIHMIRKDVEIKPLPCINCERKGFYLYQILSQKIKQKEDVIYVCLDRNIISVNNKGIWKYFQKCTENVKCDVFCPTAQNTTPLQL